MTHLIFEFWWVWLLAGPMAGLVLLSFARRHAGLPRREWLTLFVLRSMVFLFVLFLLARPTWVTYQTMDEDRRRVLLLVDESESMALEDVSGSRYRSAVRFAREKLIPAIEGSDLEVEAFLFGDSIRAATGKEIANSTVDAKRTNLAGAIAQAVASQTPSPRAMIVLTDGNATDPQENQRAVSALLDRQVPFVGVGFGSDIGPRILSLEEVIAPSRMPPRQEFRFSVRLQASGGGAFPGCELLLMRNGQLHDRRELTSSTEPRIWQETFLIREDKPGRYQYRVQLLVPESPQVRAGRSESTAWIDVTEEEHWHVLFVQGGLTWDFKFIQLAVRKDPSLRLSGLSRTASDSRFFQNVEDDTLLPNGFPTSLEQLAHFRVVVLANIRPADLRPAQQELLVRFCGELGGGVVMIGGSETFNVAWRDSPLEKLLPVRFASGRRLGPATPFQPQLTPEALQHPVFQVSGEGNPLSVWRSVPQLTEYAEVEGVKLGAEIWAEHPRLPTHRASAPLITVQRFGVGRSAAISVPNLWRWRLDQDSDPRHYDQFWQQLFRFLGGGNQDPVMIYLADQDLTVDRRLTAILEMRPSGAELVNVPTDASPAEYRYQFQVNTLDQQLVSQQAVTLGGRQATEISFRIQQPGTYNLQVLNAAGQIQGTRTIDLRHLELELASPGRNVNALRQWAGISGGLALAAEDCQEPRKLIEFMVGDRQAGGKRAPRREPIGMHWTTLALLLGCLATDWGLRKRWNWI